MTFQKRRAFGQHFLRDGGVIRSIVSTTLELSKSTGVPRVLEIGPGHGALSNPLMAEKPGPLHLLLIEKDRKLAEVLKVRSTVQIGVEVLEADFLEAPESLWLRGDAFGVVSNLPYATSTEITARLGEHPQHIAFMVLMYQREVAQRLRASVGESREIGRQTLILQNLWDVRLLCKVSRKAFSPPPKVESEVLVFTPRATPRIPEAVEFPKLWADLVRAAFSHRRKTLANGLSGSPRWRAALVNAGIHDKKRVEALTWAEWAVLFRAGLTG